MLDGAIKDWKGVDNVLRFVNMLDGVIKYLKGVYNVFRFVKFVFETGVHVKFEGIWRKNLTV